MILCVLKKIKKRKPKMHTHSLSRPHRTRNILVSLLKTFLYSWYWFFPSNFELIAEQLWGPTWAKSTDATMTHWHKPGNATPAKTKVIMQCVQNFLVATYKLDRGQGWICVLAPQHKISIDNNISWTFMLCSCNYCNMRPKNETDTACSLWR